MLLGCWLVVPCPGGPVHEDRRRLDRDVGRAEQLVVVMSTPLCAELCLGHVPCRTSLALHRYQETKRYQRPHTLLKMCPPIITPGFASS